MGRSARLRKLRREAMRQFKFDPSTAAFAAAHQREHPDSVLLPGHPAEKMSEVIQDFAQPLFEGADSPEEVKKALLI